MNLPAARLLECSNNMGFAPNSNSETQFRFFFD